MPDMPRSGELQFDQVRYMPVIHAHLSIHIQKTDSLLQHQSVRYIEMLRIRKGLVFRGEKIAFECET